MAALAGGEEEAPPSLRARPESSDATETGESGTAVNLAPERSQRETAVLAEAGAAKEATHAEEARKTGERVVRLPQFTL